MNSRSAHVSSPYSDIKYIKNSQTQSISSLNTNTSINQSNRYFSAEYDCLLQSIAEYCQQIQDKAYGNIKETCEMMRKYKIMKQFKENIDVHWKNIKENILEYLKIDKIIIQTYSEWKSSLLSCQEKVQECRNFQQLRDTVNFLQNSLKIKFGKPKYWIYHQQQPSMSQKIKTWRQYAREIESSGQVIKDYSIKIVELITDRSQNDKKFEQQSQKKANTKSYFDLRQKIIEQITKKQLNSHQNKHILNNNEQNKIGRAVSNDNRIKLQNREHKRSKCSCKNVIEKSNVWIQKILNLYEDQK